MIEIYTDGACSGNPGVGGCATVIVEDGKIKVYSLYKEKTTNNEMELTAFYNALVFYRELRTDEPLTVYTDSAYIVNCFNNKWYEKWINNNWVTAAKTPVKNKELWQNIIRCYRLINKSNNVTILKVEGHADNKYNNLADKYAVKARKNEVYNGEEFII